MISLIGHSFLLIHKINLELKHYMAVKSRHTIWHDRSFIPTPLINIYCKAIIRFFFWEDLQNTHCTVNFHFFKQVNICTDFHLNDTTKHTGRNYVQVLS